eukprot:m.105059 g.105059  ORF g.105059 m.105059 type:complete len:437 (+) comp15270_c0_seq2:215-1525(+)
MHWLLCLAALWPTMLAACPREATIDDDGTCKCNVATPYCGGTGCQLDTRPTMRFPQECSDCTCHDDLLAPSNHHDELFQRYGILHALIRSKQRAERALIYECTSMCGGTGDRLRGIITTFYLAMLTNRAFYLHATIPQPLESFFESQYIDWKRPTGWPRATSSLNYIDHSSTLVDSIIAQDKTATVSLRINVYAVPYLFHWHQPFAAVFKEWETFSRFPKSDYMTSHHIWGIPNYYAIPRFQAQANRSGLAKLASPMHAIYRRLFEPKAPLKSAIDAFASKHAWSPTQSYVAVHLRTGLDFRSDPNRMAASSFDKVFDCVANHTRTLNSPFWHVASDTKHVYQHFATRFKAMGWDPNRLMSIYNLPDAVPFHVDRYGGDGTRNLGAEVYVHLDYWLLSHANKVFASTSGFSRTAAVVGGHKHVVLVPSCLQQTVLY